MRRKMLDSYIKEYGDDILKRKAVVVAQEPLHRINLQDKLEGVYSLYPNMQGLSAPQIGVSERVMLCVIQKNSIMMFNPKIVVQSEEARYFNESCLSVSKRYRIKRPIYVQVEYENIYGERLNLEVHFPYSRIIYHECDHLEGICLPDRWRQQNE